MTTPQSADERMWQLLMQRSPGDRLGMCTRMFSAAKALAAAGIAADTTRASGLNARQEIFLRFYGSDFTAEKRGAILAALGG